MSRRPFQQKFQLKNKEKMIGLDLKHFSSGSERASFCVFE